MSQLRELAWKINLDTYFTKYQIGKIPVNTLEIGIVRFPTGRIFACDFLIELNNALSYIQVVPREEYDDWYACVKVNIADKRPIRYKLGLVGKEDMDELLEGGVFWLWHGCRDMYCRLQNLGCVPYVLRTSTRRRTECKSLWRFSVILCKKIRSISRGGRDWLNRTISVTDYNLPLFPSGRGDDAHRFGWIQ